MKTLYVEYRNMASGFNSLSWHDILLFHDEDVFVKTIIESSTQIIKKSRRDLILDSLIKTEHQKIQKFIII
jgi:hypothetical protein